MKKISQRIFYILSGIILTLIIAAALLIKFYPLEMLEYKTYDLRAKLKLKYKKQQPNNLPLVIITINDNNLTKTNKLHEINTSIIQLLNKLSKTKARVIGINNIYSESANSHALDAIKDLKQNFDQNKWLFKYKAIGKIYETIKKYETKFNHDKNLSNSLKTLNNVVMPILFYNSLPTKDKNKKDKNEKLLEYLALNSVPSTKDTKKLADLHTANNQISPIDQFAKNATLGHININYDKDGVVRKDLLFFQYKDRLFPSMALQISLKYLKFNINKILISNSIILDKNKIPLNEIFINYNIKHNNIINYSFSDVINNKISIDKFKDKIVLIDLITINQKMSKSSIGEMLTDTEIVANVIDDIINNDYTVRPHWAKIVELAVILFFGLIITFIFAYKPFEKKSYLYLIIILSLLILWNLFGFYVYMYDNIWIKIFYPTVLLIIGYIMILAEGFFTSRKLFTQKSKYHIMHGSFLQKEGQLDLAFQEYMKCSIEDASVKLLLYKLGLEYENKHPDKAIEVYEYILKSGSFMDLDKRLINLKEQASLPANAKKFASFGRYKVVKEIGRGAMGIIYLGKDPKINRKVAIKTILTSEIDEETREEVTLRFYNEAEAAGKLSHPNIVRIYDVGEEQDTCYIAMELLKGVELKTYTKKNNLLHLSDIFKIITGVAKALEYAHKHKVVHRDIKPANIMVLDNNEVKVADFGIARLSETSKTQTGIALGTPSYMSPEQIAGKKVDGRADLFSLGVVFFELLTGEKPFKGDTLVSLMHNITLGKMESVTKIRSKVPKCVSLIVDKMLKTNINSRYNNARGVIDAIKRCKKTLLNINN